MPDEEEIPEQARDWQEAQRRRHFLVQQLIEPRMFSSGAVALSTELRRATRICQDEEGDGESAGAPKKAGEVGKVWARQSGKAASNSVALAGWRLSW